MGKIYDIRSAIVHGSNWREELKGTETEKAARLLDLRNAADDLCRASLRKILLSEENFQVFQRDQNKMDEFWRDRLLGRS